MKPETFAAFGAALVALVAAVLTFRSSTQANRISDKKVDAEAYDRGKALYEGALNLAERQLAQLREQVDRISTELDKERLVSGLLRMQMAELQETIARMERQIASMRARMQAHGIDEGPGNAQAV